MVQRKQGSKSIKHSRGLVCPELVVVLPAERCVAVAAGLDLADALAECPEVGPHASLPIPQKKSRNRPGRVLLGVR